MPESTAFFTICLSALTVLVCAALVWAFASIERFNDARPAASSRLAIAAGVGLLAWLALTAVLAVSETLRFGPLPPRLLLLVSAAFVGVALLVASPVGARLALGVPLSLLIGFQAFRVPVELLLHWGYTAGFVPRQMTYAGMNFDVLTGLTALPVAWLAHRRRLPSWGTWAWNIGGLALLTNIVTIAILSMPTPARRFLNDPPNEWVAHWPGVWLPTILVQAAWLGHLLVFRRLMTRSRPQGESFT